MPPGRLLRNEIRARGWTVRELAARLNYDESYLWAVIDGDAPIDQDMAVALSRILGTSAQLWLNLETAYRVSKDEGT